MTITLYYIQSTAVARQGLEQRNKSYILEGMSPPIIEL